MYPAKSISKPVQLYNPKMPGHSNKSTLLQPPPFYLPEFEDAYRWIIDQYHIAPRRIAIFLPCAVKKPYSRSPSHRLFRNTIESVCRPEDYHIVIFGTCGTVPSELELMHPFSSYRYMLGNCDEERIKNDFLEIETDRIAGYLKKTEGAYKFRVAYCIGLFREAMVAASRRSGIHIDLLLPSDQVIESIRDVDRSFPDGSLSMPEYINEFRNGLVVISRN
jgi:archaeosine synthase